MPDVGAGRGEYSFNTVNGAVAFYRLVFLTRARCGVDNAVFGRKTEGLTTFVRPCFTEFLLWRGKLFFAETQQQRGGDDKGVPEKLAGFFYGVFGRAPFTVGQERFPQHTCTEKAGVGQYDDETRKKQ